jgi:hypothetical protein
MKTMVKDKAGNLKILSPSLEMERKELYDLSLQANTMKLAPERYSKAETDFFDIKVKTQYDSFMKKLPSCPTFQEKEKSRSEKKPNPKVEPTFCPRTGDNGFSYRSIHNDKIK